MAPRQGWGRSVGCHRVSLQLFHFKLSLVSQALRRAGAREEGGSGRVGEGLGLQSEVVLIPLPKQSTIPLSLSLSFYVFYLHELFASFSFYLFPLVCYLFTLSKYISCFVYFIPLSVWQSCLISKLICFYILFKSHLSVR